jgi:hypothetical protein
MSRGRAFLAEPPNHPHLDWYHTEACSTTMIMFFSLPYAIKDPPVVSQIQKA